MENFKEFEESLNEKYENFDSFQVGADAEKDEYKLSAGDSKIIFRYVKDEGGYKEIEVTINKETRNFVLDDGEFEMDHITPITKWGKRKK